MNTPIIVVSSCILGNNVRYDGGNTLDRFVSDKLPKFFEIRPICPELKMGLGIPREPVNLVLTSNGETKMMGSKSKIDHTSNALSTSDTILNDEFNNVCGVILQKKSPSCGLERVKLYNEKSEVIFTMKQTPKNRGIFAQKLMDTYPFIPAIDSGRLFDTDERENFLRRVYCYYRFRNLDGSIRALQDFHARYKFVIMEYHQEVMRKLGNIAANSKNIEASLVYESYKETLFLEMQKIPTKKSRTNVFYHLIGFFKNELAATEKQVIHQMIADYNAGILPYMVPHKMLEFLIIKHQQYYLKNHYYLDQYPKELRDAN
jgi:uncharacterized protein YbgA (DUF1722 family)/uncharacterized protein YbbK (DUF523 family)